MILLPLILSDTFMIIVINVIYLPHIIEVRPQILYKQKCN